MIDIKKEYIQATQNDSKPKGWNFPKNHMHCHLFADILAKGVTKNYDTKINENMHGPLKDSYNLRFNFWEHAQQVSSSISCLTCKTHV